MNDVNETASTVQETHGRRLTCPVHRSQSLEFYSVRDKKGTFTTSTQQMLHRLHRTSAQFNGRDVFRRNGGGLYPTKRSERFECFHLRFLNFLFIQDCQETVSTPLLYLTLLNSRIRKKRKRKSLLLGCWAVLFAPKLCLHEEMQQLQLNCKL